MVASLPHSRLPVAATSRHERSKASKPIAVTALMVVSITLVGCAPFVGALIGGVGGSYFGEWAGEQSYQVATK